MATATAASASSSLLAPAASTAVPAVPNALLFPSSVSSLHAYPWLLLAFRRPAAAAVAGPQGAMLDEEVDADQRGQYDDEEVNASVIGMLVARDCRRSSSLPEPAPLAKSKRRYAGSRICPRYDCGISGRGAGSRNLPRLQP
ncbi:unnamed protein product [Urochloa humidicola]